MSKQPAGSVNIGNIINYLSYLPDPFPKGLEVDLDGISTSPTLMLLIFFDRLGLFSYLYRYSLNCITICQGSWVGATALCIKVGWCCTIAVSAWCSAHQLSWCECTVKRFCAPHMHLNAAYMTIHGHM